MSHSWETRSAAVPTASAAPVTTPAGISWQLRSRAAALAARVRRPELALVMALAGLLNLWALGRNGWANDYYSAAVRSMSSSWHNFLFASLDRGGVMTVDKPPLSLWVQALSVRIFGFHPLSMLVPQALMGVASVALVYDLVARRFGRVGGFVAGLALAVTPITVAVSRHNNPDALLVLCCVAAVWCVVRAMDAAPSGRGTRWLVAAGVFVGLAFETKMGVALTVLPGIAVAWLWVDPAGRGRLRALRQLLAGGGAMLAVGGAWPLLVELTPAANRPWISGTSDNRILSLIFEYNGLGRVDGQAGGPGGGGGTMFGGTPGPLRLLNSALGGQAGWLLGFALVGGLGILLATRLRRADPRTGWLLAVGGTALTTAVLFSDASGIFHPYYVSLLAPFVAALVGAAAAQLIAGRLHTRLIGPLAVVAGVAAELVVRGDYPQNLGWLPPILIVVGVVAALALLVFSSRQIRTVAVGAALAALLIAPSVWALDTLGHATSGTFPAGGPEGLAGDGPGGFGGRGGPGGGFPGGGGTGGLRLFGPGGSPASQAGEGSRAGAPALGAPGSAAGGSPPTGAAPPTGFGPGAGFGGPPGGGAGGGFGAGGSSVKEVVAYVNAHGGGTIALSSQSMAASAILEGDRNVAGIGGFSGRESAVSVAWLAQEVGAGKIRWVVGEASGGGGRGLPGDSRAGSKAALAAVAKACRRVTLSSSTATSGSEAGTSASTLYDCAGRASALSSLGA
jgi:4-amino-4-deoxy-L-arabinose transferase-like glycosyltransferase